MVAGMLLHGTSPAIAHGEDTWARAHLKAGTSLVAVRRALQGEAAYEVVTERITLPAARPLAGRTGRVLAMVLFDRRAGHERLVLFRQAAAGLVVDRVVDDARLSYSYREVFYQARYARQFDELEHQAAAFVGQGHERFVGEKAIHGEMTGDPAGGPDGVYALTLGGRRHVLLPFGEASVEDTAPLRVLLARDGRALASLLLVGNGLPSAMARFWRKEAGPAGRFRWVKTVHPRPFGP